MQREREGAEMIKRIAKKGTNAGKEFWGCSEYPWCWEVVKGAALS